MLNLVKRLALPTAVAFIGVDGFFAMHTLLQGHVFGALLDLGAAVVDFEFIRRAAKKQGYL